VDQHLTAHGRYYAGKMGSRFYIALRDKKKILGTPCKQCKQDILAAQVHVHFLLLGVEEHRGDRPLGTLETFTVVTYDEPIHPRKAPFIYGIVKLAGRIRACPPD